MFAASDGSMAARRVSGSKAGQCLDPVRSLKHLCRLCASEEALTRPPHCRLQQCLGCTLQLAQKAVSSEFQLEKQQETSAPAADKNALRCGRNACLQFV